VKPRLKFYRGNWMCTGKYKGDPYEGIGPTPTVAYILLRQLMRRWFGVRL